ncbi:MAG: flagellar basal body P-ring formation chaperone FlgA [Synergistaceae bacterium]|nr:flagellar basal body P-ring formation chaperone FlgA [Synergistaceae bacterium]
MKKFMSVDVRMKILMGRAWSRGISAGLWSLALMFVLLTGTSWAFELRVELPEALEARDGGFLLGEYAEFDGDTYLADVASMVWIEPRNGKILMSDVIEALGTSEVAGRSVMIAMPDEVKVLPESEIASELRVMTAWKWRIDVLGITGEQIEKYSRYSLPPRVQPGSKSVSIKLVDADGDKTNRQIKLKWFQPVVYSLTSLQRGAGIDVSTLRTRVDSIGMIGESLWSPEQLAHSTMKQSIGAGKVIAASDVAQADLVKAGSSVKLIAKVNGLGIEVNGIAMQRGGIGDVIKVRNLSSRKVLSGKIVDVGRVAIN